MSKKNIISKILCFLLVLTLLLPTMELQKSQAAGFIKCYTISSGYTTTYSSSSLKTKIGTIYPSDELRVLTLENKYCKVSYPTAKGSKTAYIPTSAILLATEGYSREAAKRITTYRRNSTSYSYGYIEKGDKIIELGQKGSFTQVFYPVSGGNKIAWIRTSDASWKGSETSRPIADGIYLIECKNGLRLDVNGASRSSGANIQLWEKNDTDAQTFKVEYQNNGYYKITNTGSGKVLDIDGGVAYNGANVMQYDWHGGSNQQWKIISSSDSGYYQLLSAQNTNQALDISGGIYKNGTNIQSWERNTTNAQKWKFVTYSNNNSSTSSGLTSPVPAGCKFSKKTQDGSWYGYHDINRNVSSNTPVYAISDGTVTYKQAYRTYGGVKYLTSYGNYIEFTSSNGIYSAKYCHLSRFSGANQIISSSRTKKISGSTGTYKIKTKSVKKGEIIGYIGTTGNSSGIHLHFELRKNGTRIDPTSIFSSLK